MSTAPLPQLYRQEPCGRKVNNAAPSARSRFSGGLGTLVLGVACSSGLPVPQWCQSGARRPGLLAGTCARQPGKLPVPRPDKALSHLSRPPRPAPPSRRYRPGS